MKRLFTSCFGLGFLPIAPGTWGSALVAVVFGLLCYFGVPVWIITVIMAFLIGLFSTVCVRFGPAIIEETGKKDPGEVVADEVAGQAVTFIGACAFGGIFQGGASPAVGGLEIIITAVAGFLIFRALDIIKPWPCRRLEKLPLGWGVLADDLMAGVYAAIVLQLCLKLWVL